MSATAAAIAETLTDAEKNALRACYYRRGSSRFAAKILPPVLIEAELVDPAHGPRVTPLGREVVVAIRRAAPLPPMITARNLTFLHPELT